MKKISILFSNMAIAILLFAFTLPSGKFVSSKTQIKFFSHTDFEDIQATNNATVSSLDPATGDVVFSVPMQSFEFEKALMQKHFNSPGFLDTKAFPKAKLKGTITNLSQIDFSKNGTYEADVEGDLTIKGVTKPVKEKGTIKVTGNKLEIHTKFNITLADYGVTFVKGKPSTNIAKTVEVNVLAEYQSE